ncbi:RHS repeat protein [Novosphingobium sp. B-7]|uniref:RHS repeat protein n=1 Tax=Novosphingobium sp. B-7 TaxID=1298855 RepID=UPI000406F343|nr:RHS repeat protein [Novosphingobium sp. B-7]
MSRKIYCPSIFAAYFIFIPISIAQNVPHPPETSIIDDNGVDLINGGEVYPINLGSIGQHDYILSYSETQTVNGIVSNAFGTASVYQNDLDLKNYVDVFDGESFQQFVNPSAYSGSFNPVRGRYATLTVSVDQKTATYTKSDGAIYTFISIPGIAYADPLLRLVKINRPNGLVTDISWQRSNSFTRPVSIVNNAGYKITFTYQYDGTDSAKISDWITVKSVGFINLSYSQNAIHTSQKNKISATEYSVSTISGQYWKIYSDSNFLKIMNPSDSSYMKIYSITVDPYQNRIISKVNDHGTITNYGYSPSNENSSGIMTVTNPDNSIKSVSFSFSQSKVARAIYLKSVKDENGNIKTYTTRTDYQPSRVVQPEGNYTDYGYDSRGNLTSVVDHEKPSGTASITRYGLTFASNCSNTITCNLPTSITDANGNTTNYQYDPTHGGIIMESLPADVNGIRPVKRYAYAQRYAWISNGAGGYVKASSPIWVKTEERTCRTTATVGNTCSGGSSDEIVTVFDYGPDSGPNNLLLRGIAITADGQTLRHCFGYNTSGNKISETKPLGTGVSCP